MTNSFQLKHLIIFSCFSFALSVTKVSEIFSDDSHDISAYILFIICLVVHQKNKPYFSWVLAYSLYLFSLLWQLKICSIFYLFVHSIIICATLLMDLVIIFKIQFSQLMLQKCRTTIKSTFLLYGKRFTAKKSMRPGFFVASL